MGIKHFILGNESKISQNAFTWNIIASTLNAGLSALLLIVVTRVLGASEAGIFAIAFSVSQLMLTIGFFDMRPYQVTDVHNEVAFKYYFTSRVMTCILMLIVSVAYVLIKDYDSYKTLVVLLLCVLKMLEAFEDILHGLFQQKGRLDIAAKLHSVRIIIAIVVFIGTMFVTENLVITILVTILVSFLVIVFLNLPMVPIFSKMELDFNVQKLKRIFVACFPLFLGSYMALYMENSPKYAIDEFMKPEYQTYYSILFMPSFVVNLFSGFAFRPLLTPLAISWRNNDRKTYIGILKKLMLFILLFTIVALIGTYLLGIPVLSFLYNTPLSEYKTVLLMLIAGGGVSAVGTILYYALTVIRYQKMLLIGYSLSAISAFFIAPIMVREYGIMGAAWTFLILIFVRVISFFITFIVCYKKRITQAAQNTLG